MGVMASSTFNLPAVSPVSAGKAGDFRVRNTETVAALLERVGGLSSDTKASMVYLFGVCGVLGAHVCAGQHAQVCSCL